MKATIKITEGAVRIFKGAGWQDMVRNRPEPTYAPASVDVEEPFGVGSGAELDESGEHKQVNAPGGKFEITTDTDGELRVYTGGGASPTSSMQPVTAGKAYAFSTIESNAVTVTTGF